MSPDARPDEESRRRGRLESHAQRWAGPQAGTGVWVGTEAQQLVAPVGQDARSPNVCHECEHDCASMRAVCAVCRLRVAPGRCVYTGLRRRVRPARPPICAEPCHRASIALGAGVRHWVNLAFKTTVYGYCDLRLMSTRLARELQFGVRPRTTRPWAVALVCSNARTLATALSPLPALKAPAPCLALAGRYPLVLPVQRDRRRLPAPQPALTHLRRGRWVACVDGERVAHLGSEGVGVELHD